jgi:hypothetical protein
VDIPVHTVVNPESTQLMKTITQLVRVMAQDREAMYLAERWGCTLKDFCSHNSDNFDGSANNFSTENWLTHQLTSEAKRWWQSKKDLLILDLGSEHAITWEIFRDEFHKQFFLQVVQEAKVREFMDLVQGSMMVMEYATKFIQLLRFVVYLILDEEKKAKKFKRGLSPRIKTMMTCFEIHNFSQLVDHALIYEESLKDNAIALVEQRKMTCCRNSVLSMELSRTHSSCFTKSTPAPTALKDSGTQVVPKV